MVGIEELVRPHEGDEDLSVAKIDDIMRPAGDHVDGFDLVAADLKADFFIRVDIALFDQRTIADDDEELPLGVVPVLTLGDTGLADIHAELSVIGGLCFQPLNIQHYNYANYIEEIQMMVNIIFYVLLKLVFG